MVHRWINWLQERNPFYLLSAFSMLTGCYALSRALELQPGSWRPLLVLIGILQAYEFLLLGLAAYLLARVHAGSDARTAFLIGLLFVTDTTYLNTELATANPWTAPWVALAHLAFLVPKLFVLRDALGLTSLRTLSVVTAQIGFLVYLPGIFSAVHFMDSKVHALGLGREMLPLVVYGLWWILGTLPLVYLWADRASEHGREPVARVVSRVSLMLPFASILLHLLSLHWMYGLPIYGSYVTPLLLGIFANATYAFSELGTWRRALQWGGPIVALGLSATGPEVLAFSIGPAIVSPIRAALIGVAFVFWAHRVMSDESTFLGASAAAVLLALSGHTVGGIQRRWTNLFPETYAELGVALLVAAFALLSLALAVSLWRPKTWPEPDGAHTGQASWR